MEINEAIEILEKMSSFNVTTVSFEAWQTLKSAVLAQQSTNKPSMKCGYFGKGCRCSYPVLGFGDCGESACVFTATNHA